MSDFNSVIAQIRSMINLANETTGKGDTNLTDSINSLISGYGQGDSGDSGDNGNTGGGDNTGTGGAPVITTKNLYVSSANEGKFSAYAGSQYAFYEYTCFAPTVTFEGVMTVQGLTKYQGAYGNGGVITEAIDLTNYDKLVFDYECNIPAMGNDNFIGVFISPVKQPLLKDVAVYNEYLLHSQQSASTNGTKEVDISGLNGEYYIGFSMQYTSVATIKVGNMYLQGESQQSGGSVNISFSDDGNGNVTISGVTLTNDGNGNITMEV